MDPTVHQLEDIERLNMLMCSFGFAIWQLQELENVLTTFFVIRVKATKGMGEEAGNELLNRAQKQTLGTTITELNKAGVIDTTLSEALLALLGDRNWLVHRARRESRGIVRNPLKAESFMNRVSNITSRCGTLLKSIEKETRDYAIAQGVDQAQANRVALQIARSWEIPI